MSVSVDMPICADMCRHVTTCDINLDTCYSDHLDLIQILVCVSTCGHADMCWYLPTCAGKCQYVKPILAPLIPTIWTLSCMLACVSTFGHADMCWYVPIFLLILYLRIPEKHGLSSWSPWSTYTTYRFRLVGHSYTFAWVITIKEGKKIKEWGEKVMWK